LRVSKVFGMSWGRHGCRTGEKSASHHTLWLCFTYPGESSFERCTTESEHGLVCLGGSHGMLALSTVALVSAYPRLAPVFPRRSSFTSC